MELFEAIRIHAAQHPDSIALRHVGQPNTLELHSSVQPTGTSRAATLALCEWDYARIWNIALRWAEAIETSVGPKGHNESNSRVALAVSDGPFLPLLHLACVASSHSVSFVPIDTSDPRLPLILEDAAPVAFVLNSLADLDSIQSALSKISSEATANLTPKAQFIYLSDLVKLDCSQPPNLDLSRFSDDNVSHIYFTSGSTGRPKGCVVTLSALTSYCISAKPPPHRITASSTVFIASSHTFDPSLGDHLSSLATGCTIARADRALVTTSLSTCLDLTRATHVCTNPTLFDTVQSKPPLLQLVALGGEVMGTAVVKRCEQWGVELLNTYGVTECAVYQMCSTVTNVQSRKYMGSRGMGQNEILIMQPDLASWNEVDIDLSAIDPLAMVPVTGTVDGEMGELWIGGTQVGRGYLNRPELTKQRFLLHPTYGPVFRTGDLAKVQFIMDPIETPAAFNFKNSAKNAQKAALVFVGRSDTQIKVNGQRVEVEEVEASLLRSLADLIDSIAVVWNAEAKMLVAYIVPNTLDAYLDPVSGTAPTESQKSGTFILQEIAQKVSADTLPRHMIPSTIILLRSLPISPTGKVYRANLSSRPLDQFNEVDEEDEKVEEGSPLASWVSLVTRTWKTALGLSESHRIAGRTRFSELGGDSLKALVVCQKLNSELRKLDVCGTTDEKNASGGKENDGGGFGELLGVLAPAELLKRSRLMQYAKYLLDSYSDWNPSSSSHQPDIIPQTKTTGTDAHNEEMNALVYKAAAFNHPHLAKYLLQSCSASVKQYNPRTVTPLHVAAMNSFESMVDILMEYGASVTTLDNAAATPIHLASQKGPLSLLKKLLPPIPAAPKSKPKKAKLSAAATLLLQRDDHGQTALHHASRSGAPNAVIHFIYETAGESIILMQDSWGRTPLHWAVVNGCGGCVRVLMELGADVKARDSAGEDALEIAERRARCGEAARGGGVRASVFGDIAKVLGGSGSTKNVGRFIGK
ncbi:hypothetical protein BJ741DRAFT_589061 [Chytriomyces cf. hyalinus JEL632]|nr:hypothetical protein BJ741DRAFT_589061 [Chytriomyces cf. hyalinus JEL632]